MSEESRHTDELLREVDWRFLLRTARTPRCLDLTRGGAPAGLALVTEGAERGEQTADLVVLGYPTAAGLRSARQELREGGEVACLWRAPRPAATRRARARLEAAGFLDVRFYRPGLLPGPRPELWLPLDAPAAGARALAERPPRSPREALRRRAWLRFGAVCALARLAGDPASGDGQSDGIPEPEAWVLLTGGAESDAKVVGIPHPAGADGAGTIAKFARVEKADRALEREAEVLRTLERDRPGLAGVPRLRVSGKRAGQVAIVQDAVRGTALNAALDRASFAGIATAVTDWLAALAGEGGEQPVDSWSKRLVLAPLEELERSFDEHVPAGLVERARRQLAGLGDLPLVCEHRDFGPWNIVLSEGGKPAVIDWEDAEPSGLPVLDLAYFLASAAFQIEGGLDPVGGLEQARRRNRELLDPDTELGAIAGRCAGRYCDAVGIDPSELPRLRLLTWIVQSLIALRRLPQGAGGSVPAASDAELFLALAQDEARRLEEAAR